MIGRSGSTAPDCSKRLRLEATNSILPDAVWSPLSPTVSHGLGPRSGVSRLRFSANQRRAGVRLRFVRHRHHVVALFLEFFPGNAAGQVAGVEKALDPVPFAVAAFGVDVAHAQAVGQHREDIVVGLGLAQGFDAFFLQHDQAMIACIGCRRAGTGGAGPFADVPSARNWCRRAG